MPGGRPSSGRQALQALWPAPALRHSADVGGGRHLGVDVEIVATVGEGDGGNRQRARATCLGLGLFAIAHSCAGCSYRNGRDPAQLMCRSRVILQAESQLSAPWVMRSVLTRKSSMSVTVNRHDEDQARAPLHS